MNWLRYLCVALVLAFIAPDIGNIASAQNGAPPCEDSCKDNCKKGGDGCRKDIDRLKRLCAYTGRSMFCNAAKDRGCKASQDYCETMCFVDFGGNTPKCDPATPKPGSPNTGSSWAEPHLITIDGQYYDFQAAGDFLLSETLDGEVAIHTRQAPFGPAASINTAIGLRIGEVLIRYDTRDPRWQASKNGQSVPLELLLDGAVGDVSVKLDGQDKLLIAKPGVVAIQLNASTRFRIDVYVAYLGQQMTQGLLGDSDGDPHNDVPVPTDVEARSWIHTKFADQWRLNDADSLLPYRPGETVSDFTNRSHPAALVSLTESALEAATATCQEAAVPDSQLAICIHDVALTGDVRFAEGLIDFDRAGVIWTLSDQSTLVSEIRETTARQEPDEDAGSEAPSLTVAPSNWKDEIWGIYEADAFQSDWRSTFVSKCEANPIRTEVSCACAFEYLLAEGNEAPEDVQSRVAYFFTRQEIVSNSNALDALRAYSRRTGQAQTAVDESRLIIADYRLYLSVKDRCAALDQDE